MDAQSENLENGIKTLNILPQELFEHITTYKSISFNEIYNLSLVCKNFNDALCSNELWKVKILQRWPSLTAKLKNVQFDDWKEQCRLRMLCVSFVWQQVSAMSRLCFDKEEVPKEACVGLFEEIDKHTNGFIFVVDELVQILTASNGKKNLTHKYYAERALRLIKQHYLKSTLCQFNELPSNHQIIEQGAVIISCWCQPTEDYAATMETVCKQLDDISNLVRAEVRKRSPKHKACEPLPEEQTNGLEESLWSCGDVRVVLQCLNHVLFHQLCFLPNHNFYYDLNNSYINQVLSRKTGIPISLSIVYMAVARRLGVVCLPINFPQHFLLKWKEHEDLEGEQQYTYIDVFNKGSFINQQACRSLVTDALLTPVFEAVSNREVLCRVVRNLYHIAREQGSMENGIQLLSDTLQLTVLLDEEDINAKLSLAKIYLNLDINLDEAEKLLAPLVNTETEPQRLIRYMRDAVRSQMAGHSSSPPQINGKKRPSAGSVQYSLGLIMKHQRYQYTCVIFGWDSECRASQEWIHHMGVHNLPHNQWQPFYNVLVEDGSNRYAAQENLTFTEDTKEISHPQVGKYFTEFCGTHYEPNDVKREEYPEDWPHTLQYVRTHYGGGDVADSGTSGGEQQNRGDGDSENGKDSTCVSS